MAILRPSRSKMIDFNVDWESFREVQKEMERLEEDSAPAFRALTTELGLIMEFTGKVNIRVDTGRLRASWGHFTPQHLTGKGGPTVAAEARRAAVFRVLTPRQFTRGVVGARLFGVVVGTRVRYAAPVNYRLGDFFVERSLAAAASATPALVRLYFLRLRRGDRIPVIDA